MTFGELLKKNKNAIVKRWLDAALQTYSKEAVVAFTREKDQFANPVRHTISKELENIYKELLKGVDRERLSPFLDSIIRIRAVQDFSPSQAIAFIFQLKKVIREALDKEIGAHQLSGELSAFESEVDELALIAFDVYMKRREKIYEIKAKEAKSHVYKLLERAGLIAEIPEWEPGLKQGNNS